MPLFERTEPVFAGLPGMDDVRFGVADKQAADWYVPLPPYTKLEYEWVLENCKADRVIDGGAHHGNYALVFAAMRPEALSLVDPWAQNCLTATKNLMMNFSGLEPSVWCGALYDKMGRVYFNGVSNGIVSPDATVEHFMDVQCWPLDYIDPLAGLIKLDIEGSEFVVIPDAIDLMRMAHTWIVEVHSWAGQPDHIARLFLARGYALDWVNRERMVVEPYGLGTKWPSHSTLIARR